MLFYVQNKMLLQMWLLNSFYCTSKLEAQKNSETQISEALLIQKKLKIQHRRKLNAFLMMGLTEVG